MNCVDFLFENSSERTTNFILGNQETVSFFDLWKRVNKLSELLEAKLGQGKNVILAAGNGVFFVQWYLAIMKSGNVCIPLNPAIEQDNFDFVIKRTDCALCIMALTVKARLVVPVPVLSEDFDVSLLPETEVRRLNVIGGSDLAQIIFTSGSTAEPKGVMISHANIIANTQSILAYLDLNDKDIIEVVLPFYYCYGLSLLHTHLRAGGAMVLNNCFILLGSVLRDLEKYKCTGFAGVPSHYQVLLRKSESFKKTNFPSLRYVTQAGGKLHSAFIKEFLECHPAVSFYVMYGQTEATARLSYLPPDRLVDKIGSIGKGIPGVELRVVDEKGEGVKPGETGEIIARGANLMLGYYQDPDATSHAIRNGWLYTGDLGIIDEDGFIYLTARLKEIMKIGGRRISPKEIEAVIVSLPEVVDCTVSAVDDEFLGEAIQARIVVSEEGRLTAEMVRQYCSKYLSAYKIPHEIIFTAQMDVAATGKKVKKN